MTRGKVLHYPDFVRLFHTSTPLRSVELRMKKESRDLVASTGHLCHNNHFWCEKRVLHSGFKKGWYTYNDLQNNGQAAYVGKRPQVSDPPYMHILLFEKSPKKTSNKRKQPISKDDPPSTKKSKTTTFYIFMNNVLCSTFCQNFVTLNV